MVSKIYNVSLVLGVLGALTVAIMAFNDVQAVRWSRPTMGDVEYTVDAAVLKAANEADRERTVMRDFLVKYTDDAKADIRAAMPSGYQQRKELAAVLERAARDIRTESLTSR